jgi:hypothetical protein
MVTKYPSEHQEQKLVVNWFRLQYPQYMIFSIPNGGTRNTIEAKKLKDEGLKAGIPDMIICTPDKTIFVEMKKQKGGTLSAKQKEIHAKLNDLGYEVIVGYGFKDAKYKIDEAIKRGKE